MIKHLRSEGDALPVVVSALVLAFFFAALLFAYWTDLLSLGLRLVNSARAARAETVESPVFDVRNSSTASPEQIRALLSTLEGQYRAICDYTKTSAPGKLPLLIVNGSSPALLDGAQMVINYQDGRMDSDLAPLYLVFMAEGLNLNMNAGLAAQAGHALQVVEAAGQGNDLLRQPLDAWVALLRQKKAYLPLEQAWSAPMPMDEQSGYVLLRSALESGSFMKWFTAQYGLDAARQAAQGQDIAGQAGKPIGALETAWLKSLDKENLRPKECSAIIPANSFFTLLCRNLGD